jgi:methyltransferase (TIGR00027 family)
MNEVQGDGRPSRTAIMTAVARALHREEPPPWVVDDRLADALAGELGDDIRGTLRGELQPESLRMFSRWCCVRCRYPEDIVEHELTTNGVRQYVILGAGLDSFALRRPDLLESLRVFEVDHPASQRWKRDRLRELGLAPSANLVFASVDFERQALDQGLREAGFDFDAPAVFAWIGVTMFLGLPAIRDTLDVVAGCADGTRLVLTYNLPQDALQGLGAQTQVALARVTATMDEPMITFFTPTEMEDLLRSHGFGAIEHVGPEEAKALYFPGRPEVIFGGAQRLISASLGA